MKIRFIDIYGHMMTLTRKRNLLTIQHGKDELEPDVVVLRCRSIEAAERIIEAIRAGSDIDMKPVGQAANPQLPISLCPHPKCGAPITGRADARTCGKWACRSWEYRNRGRLTGVQVTYGSNSE